MAEQADETVLLIADHADLKKLEIPPHIDWIVEEIAEQAELTVLEIPAHAELKKDAMLFQVFWKKSETEDHTASQLVPNHPQKVSRIPVTVVTAPSMIPAHPSTNPWTISQRPLHSCSQFPVKRPMKTSSTPSRIVRTPSRTPATA